MSDARWFEVEADMESAATHFRSAAALFERGGFEAVGLDGYQASMALMHALQSAHTSLEAGLLRILEMLGEARPVGDDWHMALLRRAASEVSGRPPIIGTRVAEAADETRRFRHRATHNDDSFRVSEVHGTIAAAELLAGELQTEIRAFRRLVDPPTKC